MRSALLALAALASTVAPAAAQNGFMFSPPVLTVELRAGRAMYNADSEIYRYVTKSLTLEKNDFSATSFSADAGLRATDQVDVALGLGYAASETASESREYVGDDDMPILQMTRVRHLPLTAGMRFYPLPRGESISSLAWIPSKVTPYVGAGAGATLYNFRQDGEFVDEGDLSIFRDRLEASGTAFTAYGEAGASLWLTPRVGISANGRYTFGEATMGDDYQGSALDLRGFQGSAGIAVRF